MSLVTIGQGAFLVYYFSNASLPCCLVIISTVIWNLPPLIFSKRYRAHFIFPLLMRELRGCFPCCISYSLLTNKWPQTLSDYNITQLLPHSICGSGICGWLSLVLWLRVSYKSANKVMAKAKVTSKFYWNRMHLIAYSVIVGRSQLFEGHWTEGFSSSLAVDQWTLSPPGHMGISKDQLTVWKLASSMWANEREQERRSV